MHHIRKCGQKLTSPMHILGKVVPDHRMKGLEVSFRNVPLQDSSPQSTHTNICRFSSEMIVLEDRNGSRRLWKTIGFVYYFLIREADFLRHIVNFEYPLDPS